MPISETRRMMAGGGWATPGFDIKDPSLVLYLPLWYPDSETVGSPIISKDINRRSCTVTGAVWGSQGRTFDGNDDVITLPSAASLQMGTGDWSAIVWIKITSFPSQYPCPIVFDNDGIGLVTSNQPGLLQDGDIVKGTATLLTLNTWTQIGVTRTGTTYKCYFNGVDDTATLSNPGWSLAGVYRLGKGFSNHVLNGTIGGAFVCKNRLLTPAEIQRNYQVTKWRYL